LKSGNRDYLPEIDHLRAFAAFLILNYHGYHLIGTQLAKGVPYSFDMPWPQTLNPILAVIIEGHSAVALFISLSGFILTYGILNKRLSYWRFLIARCCRIYPMMIVCLLVAIAVGANDVYQIVSSVLPISPMSSVASPFTGMFWAVKLELQCYLLFPALFWLLRNKGISPLIMVVVLAFILRSFAVLSAGAVPRDVSYWTLLGRVDQFAIGMITAKLVRNTRPSERSPFWILAGALAAGGMLMAVNQSGGWISQAPWRVLFPPIEATVWMAFVISYLSIGARLPQFISSILVALGTISYSAYLLHSAAIEAVIRHRLWIRWSGVAEVDAISTSILVVFPIVTGIATITYLLIEKPFMEMRPKYTLVSSDARAVAVPAQA
jgi:peptidoglycan/LPS O-acetylase OafA/YrhL